jgi:hypothetical protein
MLRGSFSEIEVDANFRCVRCTHDNSIPEPSGCSTDAAHQPSGTGDKGDYRGKIPSDADAIMWA